MSCCLPAAQVNISKYQTLDICYVKAREISVIYTDIASLNTVCVLKQFVSKYNLTHFPVKCNPAPLSSIIDSQSETLNAC